MLQERTDADTLSDVVIPPWVIQQAEVKGEKKNSAFYPRRISGDIVRACLGCTSDVTPADTGRTCVCIAGTGVHVDVQGVWVRGVVEPTAMRSTSKSSMTPQLLCLEVLRLIGLIVNVLFAPCEGLFPHTTHVQPLDNPPDEYHPRCVPPPSLFLFSPFSLH